VSCELRNATNYSADAMAVRRVILRATMPVTREQIIAEIRKLVAANGGDIPGERTFEAATRIKPSSWKGWFWARWTDAVRDAGYDPNALTQKIPDEELLEKLAGYVSSLDHFPVRDEINVYARTVQGFPVWQTIRKRYGGMPETAAALLEFARTNGNDRLAGLCEERIEREKSKPLPAPSNGSSKGTALGFVYLNYSPSLRLYKIGKADNPKKRGAGISLLLPDDLIPKHEIRTDCPFLLETYWHSRFKARRKQGEWFDLTSAEIESFKSRREFIFREYFP
jgi:Meiotically up-regulated gene 113